jgi:hypothetical protein
MNTIKKLYKEFFGLTEQPETEQSLIPKFTKDDVQNVKDMTDALKDFKDAIPEEEQIEEAQLINNITDYRGGVEFVLRDPSTAQSVVDEIQQWTAKKGITLVTKKISKTGNVVYMYFRLGQDPSSEAKKVQGYLSQMPELKHFRFNVRQPKKKIQPQF